MSGTLSFVVGPHFCSFDCLFSWAGRDKGKRSAKAEVENDNIGGGSGVSEVDKARVDVREANAAVKEAREGVDKASDKVEKLVKENATKERIEKAEEYVAECKHSFDLAMNGLEIAQQGLKDALSRISQQIQGESTTSFFMLFFFLLYCIRVRGFFW